MAAHYEPRRETMTGKVFAALLAGLVAFGCADPPTTSTALSDRPFFSQGGVPADGNGNKFVDAFDFTFPLTCPSGETVTLNIAGWGQFWVFGPPNNRNVELGVFHIAFTYTDAGGDTFVWHDVGPDHFYVDDGDLFVTITGRSTASGNINRDEIVVGHVVLNLTTSEVVFVAGRGLGSVDDLACDALT
jgi:hypothetical protein